MDIKKVIEDVKTCVGPIIESLGYELVEVEFKKLYGSYNLTVFIFKKGDMGLDDCEKVHDAIFTPLDEIDIAGNEPYLLNVSSMGLDWPIVTADDFRRREGEEIEVFLYSPIEKLKTHVGVLISADEDYIEIINNKTYKLERKNVAKVRPYVKF